MPEAYHRRSVLEVLSTDGGKRYVRVTATPFLIGRGGGNGQSSSIGTTAASSANCAAIVSEANKFYI